MFSGLSTGTLQSIAENRRVVPLWICMGAHHLCVCVCVCVGVCEPDCVSVLGMELGLMQVKQALRPFSYIPSPSFLF
jgi:hypothetical protein